MRRVVAGACVAAAASMVAACGVSSPPAEGPSTPPAATPSVMSATPPPASRPPSAPAEGTEAEAKAFVQRYLSEQNKATLNGDFSTVLTLIGSSCEICNRSRRYISGICAKGQTIEGGTFDRPKITVTGSERGTFTVDVVTNVLDATMHDKSGQVVAREEGSTQRLFRYRVTKTPRGWQDRRGRNPLNWEPSVAAPTSKVPKSQKHGVAFIW